MRDRIRAFNKAFLNKVTRRFAGRAHSPFALIRHVGRRSGKQYETPIIVQPMGDDFVIALTYGPEVDWYRNVVAAGGCGLVWHGHEYALTKPETLDIQTGLRAFPSAERVILRRVGIRDFVRLKSQMA